MEQSGGCENRPLECCKTQAGAGPPEQTSGRASTNPKNWQEGLDKVKTF